MDDRKRGNSVNKWMRKVLAVLMVLALLPVGAVTEDIVSENIEPEAGEAGSVDLASLDILSDANEGEDALLLDEALLPEGETAPAEEAAARYVRLAAQTSVSADAEGLEPQAVLAADSVVLLLPTDGVAYVAYGAADGVALGYVQDDAALAPLTAEEADAYVAAITEESAAALYEDEGAAYPLARAIVEEEAEEEAPEEEISEEETEEETTSSDSPDGEPASPEGEALEESTEEAPTEEEPSPLGEGAEQSEAEEVVSPEEPTEEEPTEEEPIIEEEIPEEEPVEEEPTEESPIIEEAPEEEPEETVEEAPEQEAQEPAQRVSEPVANAQPAVQSVSQDKTTVTVGNKVTYTVKTESAAKVLYAYENGKMTGSWSASSYSTSYNGVRTWKFSRTYALSGTHSVTFAATTGSGGIGAAKAITTYVVPKINSISVNSNVVTVGGRVSFTVKTDAGATTLYATNSQGVSTGAWSASNYSTVSGNVRTWKFTKAYLASGTQVTKFKATAGSDRKGPESSKTIYVLPTIRSMTASASQVRAGQKVAYTLTTDVNAKTLYAYDRSGKKAGAWSAANYSMVYGNDRVWNITKLYTVSGTMFTTFGVSAGNRRLSKTVTQKIYVIPRIDSMTASSDQVTAGLKVAYTIKSDTGAQSMYAYDASGKKVGAWAASKYSTVSGGIRTWRFTKLYTVSGTQFTTFGVSAGNGRLSNTVTKKMYVIPKIHSMTATSSQVTAGLKVGYTIKTDTGAQSIYSYDKAGNKAGEWAANKYSTVSGGVRTWRFTKTYTVSGTQKTTFGASAGNGRLSKTVSKTMVVIPKIYSLSQSAYTGYVGKAVRFYLTTDTGAKSLYSYDASGNRTGAWAASSHSTVSGSRRYWTVEKTFSEEGYKTVKFAAASPTGKLSVYSSATLNIEASSVKYRALLIGEVSFSEVCYRNKGDVNLMANMLNSIKGPTGGRYQVTKLFDRSRDQILSDIRSTFAGATEEDVSLFFIATHGAVTVGSRYLDLDYYPEYAGTLSTIPEQRYLEYDLSFGQLANALKAIPGKVIIIVESCGSGSALYSQYDTQNSAVPAEVECAAFDVAVVRAFEDADPGLLVDGNGHVYANDGAVPNVGELRVDNKFYVLTASRHKELSYGWETSGDYSGSNSNNWFTKWLCDGIGTSGHMAADTDYNGTTTLNELFSYISRVGDNHQMSGGGYQHVQVYPKNSGYALFKR